MADTSNAQTIPGNAAESARPDYHRPEQKAGQADRDLCTALALGTKGVRALGELGLPKWPAEKDKNYKIRSTISQVARYYERTVKAAVGMICADPPTLEEGAAELMVRDAEDIDGRGTHLEVFAREIAEDAINGGFMGIFVEAPTIPAGLELDHSEEQDLGLRPYWVPVTADQIISWIVEVPNWELLLKDFSAGILSAQQVASYAKQVIVRQVVIHEPTDVASGAFGVSCAQRYRVLRLSDSGVTFSVWEKRVGDGNNGEHFALVSSGEHVGAHRKPFREIPLAIVYAGKKKAPFVASPPFLPLAELNLSHYQVSADRLYLMKLCHAPTFTTMGYEDEVDETGKPKRIEVGPNAWLKLPLAGDAKYTSADPAALTSSKEEKDDLVRQMATLGMSFLGKERSVPETATARALDDAAENATHATVARGLQDGLEQAARFHATYRGTEPPSIKVNTTYAKADVDPQIAGILWQSVVAGDLDMESFIEFIKTGSLPADIMDRLQIQKLVKVFDAGLKPTTDIPAAA